MVCDVCWGYDELHPCLCGDARTHRVLLRHDRPAAAPIGTVEPGPGRAGLAAAGGSAGPPAASAPHAAAPPPATALP